MSITNCGSGSQFNNTNDNNSPTAYDISTTTLVNSSVDIILQATDPENQQLTYRIIDGPARGSLTRKTYNIYRYTPAENYEGDDDFTFRVNDGKADSNTGEVNILIGVPNHQPVAQNADIFTLFNTGCEITLTAFDPDNDSIEINIIQQPLHGTLVKIDENRYYYQPDENSFSSDLILFQAIETDTEAHATSNVGKITIEVGFTNNAPAAIPVEETINEDTSINLPFAVTLESYELWDSPITYEIIIPPSNGNVIYNNATGTWVFTPNADFNGKVEFYYRAFDGLAYSENTLVTLHITPQFDAPVVSDITLIVTESSTPYNIPIQGSDPDGDSLQYTINNTSSLPGGFSYTNGNQNAVYTSTNDVSANYGLYILTYTATDGANVSNVGTIKIVIRPKDVWFVNPGNTGLQTGQCWHQGFQYISDAVSAAKPGDQIWIIGGGTGTTHKVKPGEFIIADFTGKADLINSKGLTLTGGFALNSYKIEESNPVLTPSIIDGEDMAEHLIVKAESFCVIRNISITQGNAIGTESFKHGGGIFIPENKREISIINVTIDNSNAVSGGGIYIGKNCSGIIINNSTFSYNTSEIRGAGMAISENSEVELSSCRFSFNKTNDFGGGLSNMGTVTAENCLFLNNEAQYGGGLYDHNNPSQYTDCEFRNNTAQKSGGGIFNYGSINLIDCDYIQYNSAPRGGGIFNDASGIAGIVNVNISNCTISYNTATQNGGGIFNLRSRVLLEDSDITYNNNTGTETDHGGGGIYCTENTILIINDSTIKNNTSNMSGGGISSAAYSTLTLDQVTIQNNSSNNVSGFGGGIFLSESYATLTFTTINNNSAFNGGGIALSNYSRLYFSGNVTVSPYIKSNTAFNFGGGIYSLNSLFQVTNAHIEGNNFESPSGSGGGIYADTSNASLNSVYVERNHGKNNSVIQNYSGYHLKNCQIAALILCKSFVPQPEDYNPQHGNYLDNTTPEERYLFQFYNGL